jgi:hypothetical protein
MKETKVGWVALIAGLSGTALAFLMIFWMVGVDYKNIFGGKPFFNVPPSIPIMFEVTVLLASLTVTGAMIALFNRLPANSDPLQDSNFVAHTTSDMFGAYVESSDPKFNYNEVRNLFTRTGAVTVEDVNYPELDLGKTQNPLKDLKFIQTILAVIILTSGITYFVLNVLLYLPPFSWMHELHY